MQIIVKVEPSDLVKVREVIQWAEVNTSLDAGDAYPDRLKRNKNSDPVLPSPDSIWNALLICLLTTQQNSSADGPVNKLLKDESQALSLANCRRLAAVGQLQSEAEKLCKSLRRNEKIPRAIVYNLTALEKGGWDLIKGEAEKLVAIRGGSPKEVLKVEREAAHKVDELFKEVGLKQSRNFWQLLGLTRYVSVLDSRVMGWIKFAWSEHPLIANGNLSVSAYYSQIEDLVNEICLQVGTYPCLLDGAVFDFQGKQPKSKKSKVKNLASS